MGNSHTEWFESWFDSPYYHILYQNRDEEEASRFVARLMDQIQLPAGSHILDLACGKGRHSVFLHSLGYQVLGVDLSENSICLAKNQEQEGLRFSVGDMREPQGHTSFDLVVNLFTSFGYFGSEAENERTLRAISESLKPCGQLVIDFMNTTRILEQLVPEAEIDRGGIHFSIRKHLKNGIIHKSIRFIDHGKDWAFEEKVQALTEADFRRLFEKTGFQVVHLSGNYELGPYLPNQSDRMVFFLKKSD
jgi:SAM-dependent methyltransferase